MSHRTEDLRITNIKEVISPVQLHQSLPLSDAAAETVFGSREAIHRILTGEDDRLLVIMGPCSIHDPDAAREYADRLKALKEELAEDIELVMRVYFEKPRTTVGWKGLINDPDLDGSFRINKGLRLARGLLTDLAEKGVPAATEFLDLISPQYIADLVAWGARTTESQVHRELASGLSCPVGFKNGTDGSLKIAIDAIRSAAHPHHFMSLTREGRSAIFSTAGNEDTHIILRGGNDGPNYDAEHVAAAAAELDDAGLPSRLMVDCSHANSRKDPQRQLEVARDVAGQITGGENRIIGLMLESHLQGGRQEISDDMAYGQSVTDACLGWEDSVTAARVLAEAVRARRGGGEDRKAAST
jgi:3-deoxy-7-phosphoheptulonate synthase